MCNACPTVVNENQPSEFAERLLGILNDAGLAMMLSIGHRTGLLDALAKCGGATSHCIADEAGLHERYVRECLGALVTGKIVDYEPATRSYSLPEQHAALLTSQAGIANFGSTMQWISVLGEVESKIVDCFREGGGVPYEDYSRFHTVMADESDKTVVQPLVDTILPNCPGVAEALEQGIEVLDVGCGSGRAMIAAAQRFPNSRFTGYDLCTDTIAAARQLAAEQGVANVTFRRQDAATMEHVEAFDLVTAFDAIHDQAHPAEVLSRISVALRNGGTFLMQDIAASSDVENNIDSPLGPFLYTISCMHCMSVSLAQGGRGLGAVWGTELAREMLDDAGFESVEVKQCEHDVLNNYYVARK